MSDLPIPDTTPSTRDATCRPFGDNLFELTLSHENKAELFEEAISKLSQSSHEASTILRNLNKWNPTDASRFAPRSSSTILRTPFRLIFPNSARPSFDETGLYVRQYLAISYCWHSSDISHGSWPISKPFVDAVLEEKDHPREGIWMDQLCIDQSSPVHKAESIAAMDIIYRSCIRLVVLLEDVFLDEREAKLPKTYDYKKVPEGAELDLFASFFRKVNNARWWTRGWCLHEFGVNDSWTDKRRYNDVHNATFIVNGPNGSTVKIKWFDLHQIMSSALLALATLDNHVLSTFSGQYIFTGVERGNDVQNGMSSSLMARHNGVIQKGSRFLADRLSILINMCGLALAYVGHAMETEDEFLYFSTLLALAIGERYPLSMFSGRPILFGNEPTWLAASSAPNDTSIPRFALGGVRCVHRISMQNIELDMIFFKKTWEKITDENLERTYAICPENMPPARHVSSESEQITNSRLSNNTLNEFQRRFLAGCIMNGYTFIARLWKQLKRDVIPRDYSNGIAPDPVLQAATHELIAQLGDSEFESEPSSRLFTVEDAHLFLTWLANSRSAYYTGFLHSYRLSCTSEGQRVVVTALHVKERKFNDGPDEQLQVAIPVDSLNETCSLLRVWILRPGEQERGASRWRLVGKGLLLGEPDLMREVEIGLEKEGVKTMCRERAIVGG